MAGKNNRIIQGDCIAELKKLSPASVDLAFADPPFNIGYDYDEYDDKRSSNDYLDWSREWISEVVRVLKPNGTFWLAIGDEYAAELKVLATRELGQRNSLPTQESPGEVGQRSSLPTQRSSSSTSAKRKNSSPSPALTCRNWIVWYYTFGVHCKYKFTRSHAHLFYFVKDPKKFTFNHMDVRVPSARQLVYGDKRANPQGRMPDDTWIMRPTPHESWILRPQDLPEGFTADSDTWYFPRVCGTFKERKGFHGCQMPEQLLGRIIKACSNEGDLVLDPFAGSGTTLAVAKKLNRDYLGLELSKDYAKQGRKRLCEITPGDPLDGPENPLTSVAATKNGTIRTADGKRVKRNGTGQTTAKPRGRPKKVEKVDSAQQELWR